MCLFSVSSGTALNQIKIIYTLFDGLASAGILRVAYIFPIPVGAGKKRNEQNVRSYYSLNHRIRVYYSSNKIKFGGRRSFSVRIFARFYSVITWQFCAFFCPYIKRA